MSTGCIYESVYINKACYVIHLRSNFMRRTSRKQINQKDILPPHQPRIFQPPLWCVSHEISAVIHTARTQNKVRNDRPHENAPVVDPSDREVTHRMRHIEHSVRPSYYMKLGTKSNNIAGKPYDGTPYSKTYNTLSECTDGKYISRSYHSIVRQPEHLLHQPELSTLRHSVCLPSGCNTFHYKRHMFLLLSRRAKTIQSGRPQ